MKIQIDSNLYLTGNYCIVGSMDNAVEMDKFPECESIYYSAYQILSKTVDKPVIVYEEIIKELPISIPIFDENGEVIEYEEDIVESPEIEPKEIIVQETEYYYQLDENKKNQIDYEILNPPVIEVPPTPMDEVNNKITNIQLVLSELYEILDNQ